MHFAHIYNVHDTYRPQGIGEEQLPYFSWLTYCFNDFYTRSLEGVFVQVNLFIHYSSGGHDISKLDCMT